MPPWGFDNGTRLHGEVTRLISRRVTLIETGVFGARSGLRRDALQQRIVCLLQSAGPRFLLPPI